MSVYQFSENRILIQPGALNIGPFTFDLSPQLPGGDDIATVEVVATLDGVDKTADLISGTPTVLNNVVSVRFNYPGAALHGSYKLTFWYTLTSGAKDEADFYRVQVTDS